jgi:hypothetical protein
MKKYTTLAAAAFCLLAIAGWHAMENGGTSRATVDGSAPAEHSAVKETRLPLRTDGGRTATGAGTSFVGGEQETRSGHAAGTRESDRRSVRSLSREQTEAGRGIRQAEDTAGVQADTDADASVPPPPAAPVVIQPGTPLARAILAGAEGRMELSVSEKELMRKINRGFEESLGDPATVDPDSPEYFNKWKGALNLADELLRTAVGWDRYNTLSAQAARDAALGFR